jgi:hypothetical protein
MWQHEVNAFYQCTHNSNTDHTLWPSLPLYDHIVLLLIAHSPIPQTATPHNVMELKTAALFSPQNLPSISSTAESNIA